MIRYFFIQSLRAEAFEPTLLSRYLIALQFSNEVGQSTSLGLPTNAQIQDVFLRLHALSMPGKPGKEGREYLEKEILPAAFIADLLEALVENDPPHAWRNDLNIILFLDGFDALLEMPDKVGILLLERLIEHRREGLTDPLLVVLGRRQRLNLSNNLDQNPSFETQTSFQNAQQARGLAQEYLSRWQKQLPINRSMLRLKDLYLPVWLHDFGIEDTRFYLREVGKQRQQGVFTDEALVQAIQRVTLGHPLYLALASAAALEAHAHGRELRPEEIVEALVSPELAPTHQDEHIGDYLLSLFLSQLPHDEHDNFIFCALPRTLDIDTLRILLELPSDLVARECFQRYCQYSFVRMVSMEQIVFHPMLRNLLLRHVPADGSPASDYYRRHSLLQAHFAKRATMSLPAQYGMTKEQAWIEETYHALALGDPDPAIKLALFALAGHPTLWKEIQETVAQAPGNLIPPGTSQRATKALARTIRRPNQKDSVTAIILNTWLLTAQT